MTNCQYLAISVLGFMLQCLEDLKLRQVYVKFLIFDEFIIQQIG